MFQVSIEPNFAAWRKEARTLLQKRIPPSQITWLDDPQDAGLFPESSDFNLAEDRPAAVVNVPAEFLALAERVAAHRDPKRRSVLYAVLFRLTIGGEKHLLRIPTDPQVHQLGQWSKSIGRDIHKMHAFVRFRLTGTDEETGRENFIAWFEPEHRIVKLGAPFFRKRFAAMNWAILTPDECVSWDGEAMIFTPGLPRNAAPLEDELDELWRTYYRSIFNPARIKQKAMQAEMPKKYWKNLPESQLIEGLISQGQTRVDTMISTPERPVKPAPDNRYLKKLHEMNEVVEDEEGEELGES